MQHLRFAHGKERNLLPLYDVWEYKRMLLASRHVGTLGSCGWTHQMRIGPHEVRTETP